MQIIVDALLGLVLSPFLILLIVLTYKILRLFVRDVLGIKDPPVGP